MSPEAQKVDFSIGSIAKKGKSIAPNLEIIKNMPSIPTMVDIDDTLMKKIDAVCALVPSIQSNYSDLYYKARKAIDVAQAYSKASEHVIRGDLMVKARAIDSVVTQNWHNRLLTDVRLGRTIAVVGPSGNGKSTGAVAVLKECGYNIYHMDCTDTTTVEQLVGGLQPVGDGKGGMDMKFVEGLFCKAFKDPLGAIHLDEFDALDPRVAMALQSALHRPDGIRHQTRWLSSPDHPDGGFSAEGKCPIIVTMNTWGSGATREYVGRNTLDAASVDRFDTILQTFYEKEVQIIMNAGFEEKTANEVVTWALDMRQKIDKLSLRVILSTRRLLAIAESMDVLKIPRELAIIKEFAIRMEPNDRSQLGFDKDLATLETKLNQFWAQVQ